MLFGRSKTPTKSPMRTPTKTTARGALNAFKREDSRRGPAKEAFSLLETLEEIYGQLSFNEFEVFPLDEIQKARKNIHTLMQSLGDVPVCRHHHELLNLYCETDKEVVCVGCVYKGGMEHKQHRIKAVEAVGKLLEYESTRNEEKSRALSDQLRVLREELKELGRETGANFSEISACTVNVLEETIKELQELKGELGRRLNQAYQRTTLVLDRYSSALDLLASHLDAEIQRSNSFSGLSRNILLKEIASEAPLVEELIQKFGHQRQLVEQWHTAKQQTNKLAITKHNQIVSKADAYIVTEF